MSDPRRTFPTIGACSLLVALTGCDPGEVEYDDSDFTQTRAADGGRPCSQGTDYNFECMVDRDDLQPWEAVGMVVPDDIRSKFGLWTTMSSASVPEILTTDCEKPPPGGEYAPVKLADMGGVTRGDIVVAKEAVTIYRAYSVGRFDCGVPHPAGQVGSWWALTKPAGSKQAYHESLGICPAWNDLSMLVSCQLAAGTVALVGPTQSVSCTGTSSCDPAPEGWEDHLPVTTEAQLFINSYGRPQTELDKFLVGCTSEPWDG